MANWSQSHLLQSLGWATLNSFWQMALLWCLYLAARYMMNATAAFRYRMAVSAIFIGFLWFAFTFFYFYQHNPVTPLAFFNQQIAESNDILNAALFAASVSYLILLTLPSYRLLRNWRFVQRIKKEGLHKIELGHRLFVQKIGAQLQLGKKVSVFVSDIVQSPLTVGYLKPVILIPVAALNNLSTHQVEAILLHELSHIRRADYVMNLLLCIINTILYFNPFMKFFMNQVELERENSCDEMVLQFGYDKMGYASALLTLEKTQIARQSLVMGAAGRNFLISRIEKIIGMEKKKGFTMSQFAGIFAALFCIVVFNSILIIREKKSMTASYAFQDVVNPLDFSGSHFASETVPNSRATAPLRQNLATINSTSPKQVQGTPFTGDFPTGEEALLTPETPLYSFAAQDEVDAQLTTEEKQKVTATVDATKKVMQNMQWKVVEQSIADAMTKSEKAQAHQEYIREAEKMIDWKNVEQNLKAKYDDLDWNAINMNLDKAQALAKIDSLQVNYNEVLVALDKAAVDMDAKVKACKVPLPDQSIENIQKSREDLRKRLVELKAIKAARKVVKL